MINTTKEIIRLKNVEKTLVLQKPSKLRSRALLSIKKELVKIKIPGMILNRNFSQTKAKKHTLTLTNAENSSSSSKTQEDIKLLLNQSKHINLENKLLNELWLEFHDQNSETHDKFVRKLLNAEEILFNKIYEILNHPNPTPEEKQMELETLTYQSKDYSINNDFSFPNTLKSLVTKIDKYLSEIDINDLRSFLAHNITANLSENLTIHHNQNLTAARKDALSTFVTGIKLFMFQQKSFGLFLCSTLVLFLRSRSKKRDNEEYHQKIYLDFENSDYAVERTALVSKLGQEFVTFIKASKSVVQTQILRQSIEKAKPEERPNARKILSVDEKIALINSLSPENTELFCSLIQNSLLDEILYQKTKTAIQIESEIGITLLIFLEAIGLIDDDGDIREVIEDGNIRTPGLVKIPENYVASIFEVPFSPCTLPLVAKPRFWTIDESIPQRNFGYGGFFYNSTLNVSGLSTNKTDGMASLKKFEVESINFVQSNFYKINKNYLELIRKYPQAFIAYHLRNFPQRARFLQINPKIRKISIVDISTFLETDIEYIELKTNMPTKSKNKSLYKKLIKRKEKVQNEYFTMVNVLMEFIHTYCIADLFQDTPFFFALSIDSRGRSYYSSAGGGFGLQAGKLSKNLIEFQGNCYDENQPIDLPCINDNENEEIFYDIDRELLLELLQTNDFYSLIKMACNIKSSYEGMDASGSGASIISGLIGFEIGLKLTNVLKDTNSETSGKQCIYTYFKDELVSKIQANYHFTFNEMFNEDFIKKQAMERKSYEDDIRQKLVHIFNSLEEKLFIRQHVKEFVMCQNFAQTNKGRSNYIFDYFIQPLVALDTSEQFTSKDKTFLKNVSFQIARWIGKHYTEEFPMLTEFSSIMRTKINYEKPLLLTTGEENSGNFKIRQIKYTVLRTYKPSFKKNPKPSDKKHEISYFIPTNQINKLDAARSATANFTHFLDSRLCALVIFKCIEKRIPIFTNHDCFYTIPSCLQLVKEIYFESFKELFIENSTLTNFFNENETKHVKKLNQYLEKIGAAKMRILDKIERRELVMSEYILC